MGDKNAPATDGYAPIHACGSHGLDRHNYELVSAELNSPHVPHASALPFAPNRPNVPPGPAPPRAAKAVQLPLRDAVVLGIARRFHSQDHADGGLANVQTRKTAASGTDRFAGEACAMPRKTASRRPTGQARGDPRFHRTNIHPSDEACRLRAP
jgi:hypothetical protein